MTFREYVVSKLGKWPEIGDNPDLMNSPYADVLAESHMAWMSVMFDLLAEYDEQRAV